MTSQPGPGGLGAKARALLQILWTTWVQGHRSFPPAPSLARRSLNYLLASTGSTEAPLFSAMAFRRLWKRTDRISTGWRGRP